MHNMHNGVQATFFCKSYQQIILTFAYLYACYLFYGVVNNIFQRRVQCTFPYEYIYLYNLYSCNFIDCKPFLCHSCAISKLYLPCTIYNANTWKAFVQYSGSSFLRSKIASPFLGCHLSASQGFQPNIQVRLHIKNYFSDVKSACYSEHYSVGYKSRIYEPEADAATCRTILSDVKVRQQDRDLFCQMRLIGNMKNNLKEVHQHVQLFC